VLAASTTDDRARASADVIPPLEKLTGSPVILLQDVSASDIEKTVHGATIGGSHAAASTGESTAAAESIEHTLPSVSDQRAAIEKKIDDQKVVVRDCETLLEHALPHMRKMLGDMVNDAKNVLLNYELELSALSDAASQKQQLEEAAQEVSTHRHEECSYREITSATSSTAACIVCSFSRSQLSCDLYLSICIIRRSI
jgi:hypothetical protein